MKRRELVSGATAITSLLMGSGCASFVSPTSTSPPQRSYVGDGNWPMARADRHNSGGISTELDWQTLTVRKLVSETVTDRRHVSALTFANGYLVAVVGDRTVLAWNVNRGEEVWRRETERAVTTDPAIADESVYVPTESRVLVFGLESGERRWAIDATSLDLPLLPSGDRLVIEDKPDSELVGLDSSSGDQAWSYAVDHSPMGVAVAGEQVFVTQRGEEVGVVTALGVQTGEERWRRDFDPVGVVPTVADDRVLVGTKTGTVFALRRSDGKTIWSNRTITAREGHFLPLASDERAVYVAPNNSEDLVALSLADGTELWRVTTGRTTESVALTENKVLSPRRDQLTVYGKNDGIKRKSWEFGTDILAVCPTADGVFVASGKRVFHVG